MTSRAPYHSIRQVPVATMMSTTGASFILMFRAARAASTFSRLWRSKRSSSYSSRAKALTTRIDEKTSATIDTSSLSFFRTSRDVFLMRRVKAYTTRNRIGAMESEMSVKRQFRYSITPMMPTSVSTLVTIPSSAVVTKLWTASMSLVTRPTRSPVRLTSCSASERR